MFKPSVMVPSMFFLVPSTASSRFLQGLKRTL